MKVYLLNTLKKHFVSLILYEIYFYDLKYTASAHSIQFSTLLFLNGHQTIKYLAVTNIMYSIQNKTQICLHLYIIFP